MIRNRKAAAITIVVGALAVLSLLVGCVNLKPAGTATGTSAGRTRGTLDLSILSAGMTKQEVARVEPPPDRVVAMESQTMTVEEWIYDSGGSITKLYFANGLLENWEQ